MAIVFAMFFTVIGTLAPNFYHKYLDNREYIHFKQPISFARSVYNACEKIPAIVTWHSEIEGKVETDTRMVRTNEDGSFTPVKQYKGESFVTVTPKEGVVYSLPFTIPCDLPAGTYFFEGIYTYHVDGIIRHYKFTTDPITISSRPIDLEQFEATPSGQVTE